MDWREFSKELEQSGFFEICGEIPQIPENELQDYTGLCSYADIQKNMEAQKLKSDLEKIWAFFGKMNARGVYGSFDNRLSFSFLKHVDSVRNPKPVYPNNSKQRNFALGRAFEDMLTDCLDVGKFSDLTTDDFQNIEKMCAYAKTCTELIDFLNDYETQVEFVGTIKGYKVKGKLDFFKGGNLATARAGDLKTTSAKSHKAFLRACLDFGYYTQGYIYCKLAHVDNYIIAGVCKSMPAVFIVNMNKSDFEAGEKEFDRLLENLEYYDIAHHFKTQK